MTQEDKELLLKDLCARLPYGVKYQDRIEGGIHILSLNVIHHYERFIPYLRPMSSMTEEERDEVEEISHGWFYINEDGEIYPMGRLTDCGEFEDAILPTFEYFLKNHIDYRDLIDKGLAIEAPEGMYN